MLPDRVKQLQVDVGAKPGGAETEAPAWPETLHLADRFRFTVYDAAYLELAQRRALPLATLDQDLRAVAEGTGVALLGTTHGTA